MAYIDDAGTQKANMGYIRSSMNEPMLERDHEFELAVRWKEHGDEKALHELIRSYTRLVIATAAKFKHYGLQMGDLIQEGNVGLMQAANKFEPSRDVRFSTYATWWIRASIQDYILRNWSIVRTGTTSAHKSLFFNLRRLRVRIEGAENENGLTSLGREKIAGALGVRVKDVEDMEGRLSRGDQSLNAMISDDGEEEVGSFLADTRPNPEDVVIGMKDAQTRSKWLNDALTKLSEREQHIIRERHMQFDDNVTLEDLGKKLGVSKERVRQLESRALEKLRDTLSQNKKVLSNFVGDSA
jgi:RNA polymerase sigma-32 factor